MPAKAGIQGFPIFSYVAGGAARGGATEVKQPTVYLFAGRGAKPWIPAFAGMTFLFSAGMTFLFRHVRPPAFAEGRLRRASRASQFFHTSWVARRAVEQLK